MCTILARCAVCGREEEFVLNNEETELLELYQQYGRQLGYIQDLFPRVPAWIRSGAIDLYSNGFCICPDCQLRVVNNMI